MQTATETNLYVLLPNTRALATCRGVPVQVCVHLGGQPDIEATFEISKCTALGVNERAHQPSNPKPGFLRLIETLGPLTLLSLQPRSLVTCLDFRDKRLSLSQGLVRDWTQKSAFKLHFQVIFFSCIDL